MKELDAAFRCCLKRRGLAIKSRASFIKDENVIDERSDIFDKVR